VKALKVAHITTVDMSLRYLLLNQLRSLQECGYEVVAISSAGSNVATIEAAGIRHIAVPMTRTMSPLADLQSLWRLSRVMRREQFTIVHTHTPKPGLLGQLAARLAGVPVVINTIHGFYVHAEMHPARQRFGIALETVAARCSDMILSQNREDMQFAIQQGICPAYKIAHLGNGIDLTRFDPARVGCAGRQRIRDELGIPLHAPVVGFVGRLAGRRKGFLDFLRASSTAVQQVPDTHMLIVGDADYGKPDAVLPEAAAAYGIAGVCHFTGHRPNEELPAFYQAMDVLVLPSLFEGIPRAVIEAAAMGVPAVVTDVKGNREVVEHHRNGVRVPYGDVPQLAAAIIMLLRNAMQRQAMGAEGRRMVQERFDERHVFERVQATYARILNVRGITR
jgi:glycosyltransferase involved in cell wall biosynthesis